MSLGGGVSLVEREGEAAVGEVTSGSPSPTLGANLAMGYVKPELAKPGTSLLAVHKDGKTTPITVNTNSWPCSDVCLYVCELPVFGGDEDAVCAHALLPAAQDQINIASLYPVASQMPL